MAIKSTLTLTAAAVGITALMAQPAQAIKDYSFKTAPNQVACSEVAGPNEFKRIAPKDSPTTAVKVCYITHSETFWPSRYNVVGGYLYLVRGVAYRVKELSESTCSDTGGQNRPMMDDYEYDYGEKTSIKPMFAPVQIAGLGDFIFIDPCSNFSPFAGR